MATNAATNFEFAHQYKSRGFQDQQKLVLEHVERGGVSVIRRSEDLMVLPNQMVFNQTE